MAIVNIRERNKGYGEAIEDITMAFDLASLSLRSEALTRYGHEQVKTFEIFKETVIGGLEKVLEERHKMASPKADKSPKPNEISDYSPEERQKKEKELSEFAQEFDESEFVEGVILPKWKEIFDQCTEKGIPVLFSVARSYEDDKGSYASGMIIPAQRTPNAMVLASKILAADGKFEGVGGKNLTDALLNMKNLSEIIKNSPDDGECNCPFCVNERKNPN